MSEERTIAGRYRLDEQVGSGGMGSVWRALDLKLGRVVAVKRSRTSDDGQIRREARIGAGLHHPRVVTVFDVVEDHGERWMVMEYLPSRSLAKVLAEDGSLSPAAAARVGVQIADALAAMHERSMVHRDVTPGNILVGDDGTAKLADFGIARWSEATRTGGALTAGTPEYLAPEMAAGEEVDSPADVFSLGATLFTAVEGRSPWGSSQDGPYALLGRAAAGETAAPVSAGALAPVLTAMLAAAPEERPTARAVKATLEDIAGIALASAPLAMTTRASGTGGRRWLLPAAALLLVAVTAGTTVALVRSSDSTERTTKPAAESSAVPAAMATVGDPRTADVCALLLRDTITRFGDVWPDTEYGGFNRCGDWIYPGPGKMISIGVEILGPDDGVKPPGEFGVKAWPPSDGQTCGRYVDLIDANRFFIEARTDTGDTVSPETLCSVADAVTTGAMSVAARGPVPRRQVPLPGNSLASQKACDLLTEQDVTAATGVSLPPESGYGDWACGYATNEIEVGAEFYRLPKDRFEDKDNPPRTIRGRPARFTSPSSGDDNQQTCLISLEYRPPYVKETREHTEWVETIQFSVELDPTATQQQQCAVAEKVATAVADKIPFG